MQHHHHFYCECCGGAFDIDADPEAGKPQTRLLAGFHIRNFEISFRGLCAQCGGRGKKGGEPARRRAEVPRRSVEQAVP